jgi:hypothetical protein
MFSLFRKDLGLPLVWPAPLQHITAFVAYMYKLGLSHSTINSYMSGLSLQTVNSLILNSPWYANKNAALNNAVSRLELQMLGSTKIILRNKSFEIGNLLSWHL